MTGEEAVKHMIDRLKPVNREAMSDDDLRNMINNCQAALELTTNVTDFKNEKTKLLLPTIREHALEAIKFAQLELNRRSGVGNA
jgi:hypothetical protein